MSVSPVLWQSEDGRVALIDVPRSIAAAQGTRELPYHADLLSTEPLSAPFPTNEPKTAKARAAVSVQSVDADIHREYEELLSSAMDQVKLHHSGSWCLPRFVSKKTTTAKKRRLDEGVESDASRWAGATGSVVASPSVMQDVLDDLLSCLADKSLSHLHGVPSGDVAGCRFLESDHSESWSALKIRDQTAENGQEYRFRIPPRSSFYMGNCLDLSDFHRATRAQAEHLDTRRKFDLVLLDPPWPNRSVKRTHKTANSTYDTVDSLNGVRQLLLRMDLDVLMADGCLVGIWITNKAQLRELVVGEAGVFACWGVTLLEEWIWLKTTTRGEPVTPVNCVWRKPYEVLLLGRRRVSYAPVAQASQRDIAISRRVIVSVPDLHSRKPCLKELIESLMLERSDYRALEVFARQLTAGWWSIGDQCIKFNWENFWRPGLSSETSKMDAQQEIVQAKRTS